MHWSQRPLAWNRMSQRSECQWISCFLSSARVRERARFRIPARPGPSCHSSSHLSPLLCFSWNCYFLRLSIHIGASMAGSLDGMDIRPIRCKSWYRGNSNPTQICHPELVTAPLWSRYLRAFDRLLPVRESYVVSEECCVYEYIFYLTLNGNEQLKLRSMWGNDFKGVIDNCSPAFQCFFVF